MTKRTPYFLFTHTPLHVGAGQSVGYVDSPIQREPHTKIPIIPGSSLKGVLRSHFKKESEEDLCRDQLFGKGSDKDGHAGSLMIGEARVLCFPVRSAKGSFAWVTCPLVLARASRDEILPNFAALSPSKDDTVMVGKECKLLIEKQLVLEDYPLLTEASEDVSKLEAKLKDLIKDDVWQELSGRLVIVSNGTFTHFVQTGCTISQHVCIDDETGTAKQGALYNEETVPSETLFHGVIAEQSIQKSEGSMQILSETLGKKAIQIGGGETTGLGWCSLHLTSTAA